MRLVLNTPWYTSIYDYSPAYLYWNFTTEHFEVGSYSTANKYKSDFSKEEIEQLKKDYDISMFRIDKE